MSLITLEARLKNYPNCQVFILTVTHLLSPTPSLWNSLTYCLTFFVCGIVTMHCSLTAIHCYNVLQCNGLTYFKCVLGCCAVTTHCDRLAYCQSVLVIGVVAMHLHNRLTSCQSFSVFGVVANAIVDVWML